MTAGDNVVLSWRDELGNSEEYTKELAEGSDEPLLWVIDEIKFLIAGGWCELSYTVNYKDGGKSQSPVQRFTIKQNAGQSPSLPPPVIPGHSDDWLDPAKYGDGLPVEVDDYGIRHGDELLLTAVSKKVSRHMLRIDRSILDSKRLRFLVPAQWLQEHIGDLCPIDPHGKKIARQVFGFDAVDNIRQVVTQYDGGGRNLAIYHFKNPADPAQLSGIENRVDDLEPTYTELHYDENGNLTHDEAGRILEYDALNRLIKVTDPEKGECLYGYDPQNILSSTESEA